MSTQTIAEFLEARIAEDEAIAQGATAGPWTTMTEETSDGDNIYYTVEHGTEQLCDMALTSRQGWHDAEHIARHDPSRVLAECAAKRAIIELADHALATEIERRDASALGAGLMHSDVICRLAAVYASHPDYRQEWA